MLRATYVASSLATGNLQRSAVVFGSDLQDVGDGAAGPGGGVGIAARRFAEATLQHVGVDDAGVERHGGHAVGQFLSERCRQAFDGPLGGAVGSDLGRRRAAPAGAEVDDHAGAVRDHAGGEMANDIGHPFDVDVDDARELVGRNLAQRRVAIDERGVVHEQIDRAQRPKVASAQRRTAASSATLTRSK